MAIFLLTWQVCTTISFPFTSFSSLLFPCEHCCVTHCHKHPVSFFLIHRMAFRPSRHSLGHFGMGLGNPFSEAAPPIDAGRGDWSVSQQTPGRRQGGFNNDTQHAQRRLLLANSNQLNVHPAAPAPAPVNAANDTAADGSDADFAGFDDDAIEINVEMMAQGGQHQSNSKKQPPRDPLENVRLEIDDRNMLNAAWFVQNYVGSSWTCSICFAAAGMGKDCSTAIKCSDCAFTDFQYQQPLHPYILAVPCSDASDIHSNPRAELTHTGIRFRLTDFVFRSL